MSSTHAYDFFDNESRGDRRPFAEFFQEEGKESSEKRTEVIDDAVVGRLKYGIPSSPSKSSSAIADEHDEGGKVSGVITSPRIIC